MGLDRAQFRAGLPHYARDSAHRPPDHQGCAPEAGAFEGAEIRDTRHRRPNLILSPLGAFERRHRCRHEGKHQLKPEELDVLHASEPADRNSDTPE